MNFYYHFQPRAKESENGQTYYVCTPIHGGSAYIVNSKAINGITKEKSGILMGFPYKHPDGDYTTLKILKVYTNEEDYIRILSNVEFPEQVAKSEYEDDPFS